MWCGVRNKEIDAYVGEYKKGIFGKKCKVQLLVYSNYIKGIGFACNDGVLAAESSEYCIKYIELKEVYSDVLDGIEGIVFEYVNQNAIVANKTVLKIVLPGIADSNKWTSLIAKLKSNVMEENARVEKLKKEREEAEKRKKELKELEATQFYLECLDFHIKENTPCYELFREKNRIALIYIGVDRSLNFLKIDGDNKEESNGVIPFDKIHYYEKAGNIHYVSEMHGSGARI